MKTGFTLVELSIVLVIIGLLIGGVLVGGALIDSAKVQAQIRQLQQFDLALYGFKSKFKQLPGDSNLLSDPGDNDRIIENDKAAGAPIAANRQLAEEKANFWKHLTDSEMLKGSYNNTPLNAAAPYIYQIDGNAPRAAIRKSTVVTLFHTGNDVANNRPARMFWLLINYDSTLTSGGVDVVQAMAIDQKLDDGLGYGLSSAAKTVYSPITNCAGSGGPTSGPYEVNTPQDCALAVEVGLASGQ